MTNMFEKEKKSARTVFVRLILVPALVALGLFALIEVVLRSPAVVSVIDTYRPAYHDIQNTMRVHVEKQLWHLEHLANDPRPRIVFTGNSAVVNGIDADVMTAAVAKQGLVATNLGVTGLLAYELPLMKHVLLTPNTRMVFFLYNSFSFADDVHPDAVDVRWDTNEALRLAPIKSSEQTLAYINRTGLQIFQAARYRGMLHTMAGQYFRGTLKPLPYAWDYDPAEPPPPQHRPRVMEPPISSNDWFRRSYIDSTNLNDTLSYRGLVRFCELAKANGTRLIVGPMPEPEFAAFNRYAQGADKLGVDRKVKAIADRCGAEYLSREPYADMEKADHWFRDPIHFGTKGRNHFSFLLAERIGSLL